jgi:hypothetical protein
MKKAENKRKLVKEWIKAHGVTTSTSKEEMEKLIEEADDKQAIKDMVKGALDNVFWKNLSKSEPKDMLDKKKDLTYASPESPSYAYQKRAWEGSEKRGKMIDNSEENDQRNIEDDEEAKSENEENGIKKAIESSGEHDEGVFAMDEEWEKRRNENRNENRNLKKEKKEKVVSKRKQREWIEQVKKSAKTGIKPSYSE